jgi:glutamate/tyrosine decarboxylase-like PLP-dependent enzyme
MATKKRAAKVAPESTARPLASERRMFELTHWSADDVARFLKIRQEFFLDPMGSNKDRFVEAAVLLQRALFDWYLQAPGKFEGMTALVGKQIEHWSALRKEERRTLNERRFALNSAAPDIPAVESSVSANQWQRIFGSLGLGLGDPGTFDRFLVQLDEETNPSLRVNHRYLGELLPHDNMITYLSSVLATFLNENAIIGKVSPCVTHMEEAAVRWLLTLVGWDGGLRIHDENDQLPLQRLPTVVSPNQRYQRWAREEPTGTIVAGGTIANISALMTARSAVFDYLLGWDGAVQALGPALAWDCVRAIWPEYKRMVVMTSLGAHYSVKKAALQAGIAPCNVLESPGSENPWVLDRDALTSVFAAAAENPLHPDTNSRNPWKLTSGDLIVAVVLIAGKTETGYVDDIQGIATLLNQNAGAKDWSANPVSRLPPLATVVERMFTSNVGWEKLKEEIERSARWDAIDAFYNLRRAYVDKTGEAYGDLRNLVDRASEFKNEINGARHNRLFLHVDAAHGGGYLTVPSLRYGPFAGIEHADTVTIDGHKSFYCYYPCGGLLVRTTRWARTLTTGTSEYISEDANYEAYDESATFFHELAREQERVVEEDKKLEHELGHKDKLVPPGLTINFHDRNDLAARQKLIGRSIAEHSELGHQPFNQYLEGSRGPQGIMQLYFCLATLGMRGYRSILEWTYLLRQRCEEAISLGLSDVRLVDDKPFPSAKDRTDRAEKREPMRDDIAGSKPEPIPLKLAAIAYSNPAAQDDEPHPLDRHGMMPIAGGRFLRLSDGSCNQLLVTYVPAREAKLLVTESWKYWTTPSSKDGPSRIVDTMRFLWRLNEYLWNEHLYANPTFTYYLGHTSLKLTLPLNAGEQSGPPVDRLAKLLQSWNVWAQPKAGKSAHFFDALAEKVRDLEEAESHKRKKWGETRETQFTEPRGNIPYGEMKFFCHKIVVMHPYTDESLLGDMLRRVAFWGERSMGDVHVADSAAKIIANAGTRHKGQ